jgi:hypothetical protein
MLLRAEDYQVALNLGKLTIKAFILYLIIRNICCQSPDGTWITFIYRINTIKATISVCERMCPQKLNWGRLI